MRKVYDLVEATTEDLEMLYGESALTFEGVVVDDDSLEYIFNEFKTIDSKPKKGFTFYKITGKLMNTHYKLTGSNRYPDDLTILSIPLSHFENSNALVTWRFQYGGR